MENRTPIGYRVWYAPRKLEHIPLTNQLLRLTTLTSFDFSHHCIDLRSLPPFLLVNKNLEYLLILCRNVVSETSYKRVSPPNIRNAELSSLTVSPVLERLYLPPTADESIQVFPSGSFDPPLRDILPQSLDGLPVIPQVTSLQYGVTQSMAQVFSR